MRYFIDTEFNEMGPLYPIQLISIALVAEDGREFYAENHQLEKNRCNAWVQMNVLPHLRGPHYDLATMADLIKSFIGCEKPEFWGYYADYDWVVFCQIFGSMTKLPPGWPMYCRDLKQWHDALGNPRIPFSGVIAHEALSDARWNKAAYEFLEETERRIESMKCGFGKNFGEVKIDTSKSDKGGARRKADL